MGTKHCTAILLATAVVSLVAQATAETADYAILRSHETLTIFDHYQQPLSKEKRELLLPYAPLRVIENDRLLGDQITRALEVVFDGESYFVMRDEGGGLAGATGNEIRSTLRGATVMGDTVEAGSGSILFTPAAVTSGGVHLRKGERVARIFRHGGRYYVLRLERPQRYGWTPVRAAWNETSEEYKNEQLPTTLRERLIERVKEANNSYRAFFEHFNSVTGKDKKIPRWTAAPQGDKLHWVLTKPYDRTGELAESTHQLVQDLQSMLLGKPYVAVCDNGELVIRPREETPSR